MNRAPLLKCSANTAKAIVFTLNGLSVLALTASFRLVDKHSPWRVVLLIGVVVNCFSACILGTVFGSLDCRGTNVELRASKQPVVFSIRLPLEHTITQEHLDFFRLDKPTVPTHFLSQKAPSEQPPPYEVVMSAGASDSLPCRSDRDLLQQV